MKSERYPCEAPDNDYWQDRIHALASGDLVAALRTIDDGATYEHCVRVGGLSVAMARHLQVGSCQLAYELGLYHDLGKIAVPLPVLVKTGQLDEEERALIELHADESARLLATAGKHELANLVAEHHERLDGSGYPLGRRGDELSLLGQVAGVADMYDAVTSERPYRAAMPRGAALDLIRTLAGSQFFPAVVTALEAVLEGEQTLEAGVRLAAALALLDGGRAVACSGNGAN